MTIQPAENGAILPSQSLPLIPTVRQSKKAPQPTTEQGRAEAIRVAKAKLSRRSSLRKQRDAQKTQDC
jgi:hypothetical protein